MPQQPILFKYATPSLEKKITVVRLAKTDILEGTVQLFKPGSGGELGLHGHTAQEALWMVLSGRVRFYGEGSAVLGEFGAQEGIVIPRGFKYFFENIGEEPLQIMRVACFAQTVTDETVRDEPAKFTQDDVQWLEVTR